MVPGGRQCPPPSQRWYGEYDPNGTMTYGRYYDGGLSDLEEGQYLKGGGTGPKGQEKGKGEGKGQGKEKGKGQDKGMGKGKEKGKGKGKDQGKGKGLGRWTPKGKGADNSNWS